MKTYKFDKTWKNWFVGSFNPTAFKTEQFEVGVNFHSKDSNWPKHYHKLATEITLVLEGKIQINNNIFEKDDIFVIEPGEITKPIFLEDTKVVVVKVPSVLGDKYIVEET